MTLRSALAVSFAAAIGLLAIGCGSKIVDHPVTTAPPPAALAPSEPSVILPGRVERVEDPVSVLIAASQRHFATGQHELELGHLERARVEFDQAVDLLLESPDGARTDPRLREQFDRLVDRISSYEILALAEGDGFSEKKYEPASIDELLALSTFDPPAPAPELKAAVETDLESTRHDIPIPLNAKVLSYVELFQGRLHDFIEEGLKRGTQYLPMIQNVFRAEGLPLDLAYVPLIESAFKPNALSRAKAKGVWQFMRGTALEHGLKHDWYIDERSDPEKATQAAAKYLLTLQKFFHGDWHLALASYNGGPGRVQRAMKRAGLTDLWTLVQKRPKYLPRETREYVPMILAAIVIARNPVQYGFNIEPEPTPAFDRVKLSQPVDLRRVAEWTGASVDDIQQLNPELRRWTTPVRYPDYELKVPTGTAGVIEARLVDAPGVDIAALQWYSVKKGETLVTIARKLKVSRNDLAEANYLKTTSRVAAGQKLIVPRAPATLLAARPDRPAPVADIASAESKPVDSKAVVPADRVVAEAPTGAQSEQAKLIYQVKRGDTLFSIAQLFRTTVDALRSWNHISGDNIAAGARLTIFTSTRADE